MSDTSPSVSTALTPPPASTHQQIYTHLTSFLHPCNPTPIPPQLEILPPALTPPSWPILVSPPHLGIPKRALIQAVIVAREIFFHSSPPINSSSPEPLRRRKLEAATVLLLFDPEHLTAANYHREYFSVNHESASLRVPEWSIEAEFTLVEGLLTSPGLDKHSKSPTLWSLRRWLVKRFGLGMLRERGSVEAFEVSVGRGVGESGDREYEEMIKRLHHELGLVRIAGGVHPRNYHAWQYARFILTHIIPPQPTSSTADQTSAQHSTSLRTLTQAHFSHSLLHPTDTSIWSFLHYLLITYPTLTSPLAVPILSQTISALSELEPPLRGVVPWNVGAGGAEAMWNFVRIALGGGEGVVQLPVARKGLLKRIEIVAGAGGEELRAEEWENEGEDSEGFSAEEREEIRRIIQEHGQERSDSPLMISLAPEGAEKPRYLSEKRFAWRAWVWIGRRGMGDYRTMEGE